MKEFLSQKGVKFTERNISSDPTAVFELRRRGVMTLPLTLIDEEAVKGFNQEKIEQLLNK